MIFWGTNNTFNGKRQAFTVNRIYSNRAQIGATINQYQAIGEKSRLWEEAKCSSWSSEYIYLIQTFLWFNSHKSGIDRLFGGYFVELTTSSGIWGNAHWRILGMGFEVGASIWEILDPPLLSDHPANTRASLPHDINAKNTVFIRPWFCVYKVYFGWCTLSSSSLFDK